MVGFGSWVIEQVVKFNNNSVITGMERQARATSAAEVSMARLTGRITPQEAAFLRLSQRMQQAKEAQGALIAQGATAGFVAIAVGIGYAADQASRLQRTLTAIRNETGANTAAMSGFYDTTFKIANLMGVGPNEASEVMLTISRLTAGQLSTKQMQQIAPDVANFASMVNFNRPDVSVEEATGAGIALIHQFRAYTREAMIPLFDKAYRLSGLMRESPDAAVKQMSYYETLFKGLKIDDGTSIAMMALLDRAGFRNKVGTNVRAEMLAGLGPLAMTKHFQEGQGKILHDMGVMDASGNFQWNQANGGVNYFGMLQSVAKWAQRQEAKGIPEAEIAKQIYGAMGKQGGTIGQLMADPQMVLGKDGKPGILQQIVAYLNDPNVSLQAGMKNRDNTMSFQFGRAVGNLQAVLVELGYPWLQDLTKFFKGIADNLHGFQAWLHSHRDAEKVIGAVVAGIAGLLGLVSMGSGLMGVLKFVGAWEGVAGVIGRMLPALAGLVEIPVIGWAIGIGVAAYLFATHTKEIHRAINDAALWLTNVGWPKVEHAVQQAVPYIISGLMTWGPQLAKWLKDNAKDIIIDSLPGLGTWRLGQGAAAFASQQVDLLKASQDATKYGWHDPRTTQTERALLNKAGYQPYNFPAPPKGNIPGSGVSGGVHITKVEIHVDGSKDPHDAAQKIASVLSDPRALIAAWMKTHPNVPLPVTYAPA